MFNINQFYWKLIVYVIVDLVEKNANSSCKRVGGF